MDSTWSNLMVSMVSGYFALIFEGSNMSAPSIPNAFTITQEIPHPINLSSTMAGGVSMMLIGDETKPLSTRLAAEVRIQNLPNLTMDDFYGLIRALKQTKIRMRMPVNLNFGLSVFPFNLWGIDVVQFSICGEPQVIIDDYKPNAFERCEVGCEPCK
jgi:hypothetical protein